MYFVRRALDERWKNGKAAAIYLQGHEDSVYCSQFDEYVVARFNSQETKLTFAQEKNNHWLP